jgi:hypothetical protein
LGLVLVGLVLWLIQKSVPADITYGMSFNTPYARELGLDWQEVYDAFLDDLGVRHLRLAAHWPMIEPRNDVFNFAELDYQIARAEEVGAEVVLAVGRRLPRWPECHIPAWAADMTWEEQQAEIIEYLTLVVERYQASPAVKVWQVENEPFLEVFAYEHCGDTDEAFLQREIAHVRSLDDSRPILVTDSGNLGTWAGAWRNGDMFGTSVYVHFWNPELGQFRTVIPPWFYRLKEGFMSLRYGEQDTLLIELSAEPWLIAPMVETDIEIQFSRMNLEKFEDILTYAERTRFDQQYLWGGEWWYWLIERGHPELWERGRQLFEVE